MTKKRTYGLHNVFFWKGLMKLYIYLLLDKERIYPISECCEKVEDKAN